MFQLHSFASYPIAVHHQDESGSVLWSGSCRRCKGLPLSLLFLRVNRPRCLNLSLYLMCSSLWPSQGPLLDLLQCANIFLALRSPKLETVLQVQSHKSWIEGKEATAGCSYTLIISVYLANHLYLFLWSDYSSVEKMVEWSIFRGTLMANIYLNYSS